MTVRFQDLLSLMKRSSYINIVKFAAATDVGFSEFVFEEIEKYRNLSNHIMQDMDKGAKEAVDQQKKSMGELGESLTAENERDIENYFKSNYDLERYSKTISGPVDLIFSEDLAKIVANLMDKDIDYVLNNVYVELLLSFVYRPDEGGAAYHNSSKVYFKDNHINLGEMSINVGTNYKNNEIHPGRFLQMFIHEVKHSIRKIPSLFGENFEIGMFSREKVTSNPSLPRTLDGDSQHAQHYVDRQMTAIDQVSDPMDAMFVVKTEDMFAGSELSDILDSDLKLKKKFSDVLIATIYRKAKEDVDFEVIERIERGLTNVVDICLSPRYFPYFAEAVREEGHLDIELAFAQAIDALSILLKIKSNKGTNSEKFENCVGIDPNIVNYFNEILKRLGYNEEVMSISNVRDVLYGDEFEKLEIKNVTPETVAGRALKSYYKDYASDGESNLLRVYHDFSTKEYRISLGSDGSLLVEPKRLSRKIKTTKPDGTKYSESEMSKRKEDFKKYTPKEKEDISKIKKFFIKKRSSKDERVYHSFRPVEYITNLSNSDIKGSFKIFDLYNQAAMKNNLEEQGYAQYIFNISKYIVDNVLSVRHLDETIRQGFYSLAFALQREKDFKKGKDEFAKLMSYVITKLEFDGLDMLLIDGYYHEAFADKTVEDPFADPYDESNYQVEIGVSSRKLMEELKASVKKESERIVRKRKKKLERRMYVVAEQLFDKIMGKPVSDSNLKYVEKYLETKDYDVFKN